MKTAMNLLKSTNLVTRTLAQVSVVAVTATISTSAISSSALATIDATSFNTIGQAVSSKTLILTAPVNNGSGFGDLPSMAPGDSVKRYVNYQNIGTDTGTALTLQVVASASNVLTDATRGLQITVDRCTVAYVPGSACSGTETNLLVSTPLATLASAQSLGGLTLAPNEYFYIRYTIALASGSDETTANTVASVVGGGSSIQGLSVSLTWTLREVHGAAVSS